MISSRLCLPRLHQKLNLHFLPAILRPFCQACSHRSIRPQIHPCIPLGHFQRSCLLQQYISKSPMWPCDFDKCERPAVRILGDCVICSKHLCSEHLQKSYHRCPTPEVITFLQIWSESLTDQLIRTGIFSIRRSRRQKITKLRSWLIEST